MAVTECQRLAAHRCPVAGLLDGRVALEAQRLGVQAESANLRQDGRETAAKDAMGDRLQGAHNPDRLADVGRNQGQLVRQELMDGLGARFPVVMQLAVPPSREAARLDVKAIQAIRRVNLDRVRRAIRREGPDQVRRDYQEQLDEMDVQG